MAARIGGAAHPVTPAKQILITETTLEPWWAAAERAGGTAAERAGGTAAERPGGTAAEEVGGAEQFGLLAQFAGQAGEAELPALHDVGLVSQAECDGGELLDQQHAGAGFGHGADHRDQPADHDRGQ